MRRRELMLLIGSAMAAARTLRAQQKAMPVIGLFGNTSPQPGTPFGAALRRGLAETGYVDGQTVTVEYHWAEGGYDRLPALAADLVDRKVDVIVAPGVNAALAAKGATSAIPIVFLAGDPVAAGLVASFARPGGNLTGVSVMTPEMISKRLELISELVPQAGMIAVLVNPTFLYTETMIREVDEAAHAKGLHLHVLKASSEEEINAAFASLAQLPAGALIIGSDVFFYSRLEQLATLAARRAIPAIYELREYPAVGGLISYGPSQLEMFSQAGIYAGKILKGAKPADLPVQQPTKFELVVNLKTAEALGLTIPQSILARADEVIE